jgi:hypothetical protein
MAVLFKPATLKELGVAVPINARRPQPTPRVRLGNEVPEEPFHSGARWPSNATTFVVDLVGVIRVRGDGVNACVH